MTHRDDVLDGQDSQDVADSSQLFELGYRAGAHLCLELHRRDRRLPLQSKNPCAVQSRSYTKARVETPEHTSEHRIPRVTHLDFGVCSCCSGTLVEIGGLCVRGSREVRGGGSGAAAVHLGVRLVQHLQTRYNML